MDTNVVAKKKFSLGSVFALLSALAVFVFWLYDLLKTVFSAVILDASVSDILKNLLSLTELMSIFQTGLLILSFLVLAILLLAKVRGPVLLAFPVLQVLALLFGLIGWVLNMYSLSSYIGIVGILSKLVTLFTGVLLLAGNLLFAVVVLANSKKSKKLTALAYISPAVFGLGYGLRTLTAAVVYLLNLFSLLQSYERYEEHGLSLYMFVRYVLNFDTIALLFYTVLFTLTVFFACKWIVNPYKKGEEPTSDVPAEVIEEAAAEPSTKA